MRRYKIVGTKDNKIRYCKSCRAGKVFFNEQHHNTNTLGSKHRESICGVCNTKYKQQYIALPISVDSFNGMAVTNKDMKVFRQSNDGSLNMDNVAEHIIMFGEKLRKVIKIEQIGMLRELYDQTGKCEAHHKMPSNVFATAEGKFQVMCCPVCMEATLDYKGVKYTDTVSNLVKYVAHQGILSEQTHIAVDKPLDNLFDVEVIKEAEQSAIEMPSFESTDEPSFELEEPVF